MCTILIARRVHPRFPLVLAANRDEFYARASAPPGVLDAERGIVGGQDLVAGGTWLGVTGGRFVAAVTNHRTHRAPDPTRASRGALLMELLRLASVDGARAHLLATRPGSYNEANVLVGDARSLHVAYLRDDAPPRLVELPDGLSVLTNGELTARDEFPKIARLEALSTPPWPDDAASLGGYLQRALGDHQRPHLEEIPALPSGSIFTRELLRELHAVCVHTPSYGTVSSSILMFDETGALAHWLHAEGPPCVSPLRSVDCVRRRGARTPPDLG